MALGDLRSPFDRPPTKNSNWDIHNGIRHGSEIVSLVFGVVYL